MKFNIEKILIVIYTMIIVYFGMQVKNLEQFICTIFLSIIVLILNFFIIKNEKMNVTRKFGYVAAVFGIMFIIFIPVLHGIDEGAHFYKVYSFFYDAKIHYNEENMLVDDVPAAIIEADSIESIRDTYFILNTNVNDEKTIATQDYIGAKLYSPISYITYLIPMFLFKKICNLNVFWLVMLGRLFSFCIWLLLTMYTIKTMPKKKEFMAILSLLPIVLSLVTTYTGDLVNNTVVFLFIAMWYKLYVEKRKITKREIFLITLLGIIVTFSKMVYALIFFIMFLLPEENFKSKKNKYITISGIILILILAFILNISVVGSDLFNAYPEISAQKDFIKNNIFQYIYIFIKTIITNIPMYLYQFTTGKTTMCQNSINIDNVLSMIFLIILILAFLKEENDIKLSKKAKSFAIVITITMVSIIFLSLYLQWTATNYGVGYHQIMGVQGRYFIPISALLILVNNKFKIETNENLLWTSVISINFIIILKVMMVFL